MLFAFLKFLGTLIYLFGLMMNPILVFWAAIKRQKIPTIRDDLLKLSARDLSKKILKQEITSEEIVRAYIARVKAVNPFLNAVTDDRFQDAILDARKVDKMVAETENKDELSSRYPLLGIPFTVKESVGVKGLSQVVGSLYRNGARASDDGQVVKNLRAGGAIPLLTSANPEFCLSWETNSLTHGRCCNAFDLRRTPGGSSGGEGALNGAGASVFGIGSDLSGSVRIPGLFNGLFGHKSTGGLISIKGHFPSCSDAEFVNYLQPGPLTRFATDLPIIMNILVGDNASKLNEPRIGSLKDIRIFHMNHNFRLTKHLPVDSEIRKCIAKGLEFFKRNGSTVKELVLDEIHDAIGINSATLASLENPPIVLMNPKDPKSRSSVGTELVRHLYGKPKHSIPGIFFQALFDVSQYLPASTITYYIQRREVLKRKLGDILGTNGVLFYPTFHCPAFYHNTSPFHTCGTTFAGIFNMIGFPATHIPMGLNENGLPVGFQVIAAPYQDKLCFRVAAELEQAFGGWVPPS